MNKIKNLAKIFAIDYTSIGFNIKINKKYNLFVIRYGRTITIHRPLKIE